jgi:phenylacetate-coenzyme A ligase PaaK-like adenylate-forming protein
VATVDTDTGDTVSGLPVIRRTFGDVTGLPEDGTPCIVSAMVIGAVQGRANTYAPDTGATAIRNDKGHIVAVTRLVAA